MAQDFALQFKRQYADSLDADYKMTTSQRSTYLTSGNRYEGMIVYDTDLEKHFYLNKDLNAWVALSSSSRNIYELIKADNTVTFGNNLQSLMDTATIGSTINMYGDAKTTDLVHKNEVNLNLNGFVLGSLVDSTTSGKFTVRGGRIGHFYFTSINTDAYIDTVIDMQFRPATKAKEMRVEDAKVVFAKPIILHGDGQLGLQFGCNARFLGGINSVNGTDRKLTAWSNFRGYAYIKDMDVTSDAPEAVFLIRNSSGGVVDFVDCKFTNTSLNNPQTNGQYWSGVGIQYQGVYPTTVVTLKNCILKTANSLAHPIYSTDNKAQTVFIDGECYFNNANSSTITLSRNTTRFTHIHTDMVKSVNGNTPDSSGNVSITVSGGTSYSHPNHTGDVTSNGDGATTIVAKAVTLAKMNDLAANTIIGNNTASLATPKALTVAETKTLLNISWNDVSSKPSVEVTGNKGVANGYVPLNASTKIDTTYLPDSLLGQVIYKGTFDVNTDFSPAADTKGHYYIASADTTVDEITYHTGDWIISNGIEWQKVDNTDAVTSVFGRIGAVTLEIGDLPSIKLNDLSDVTISTVANNQLLKYNSTSSKWENWTPTYLTAEADTLATVTGRSATTTNSITIGGLSITGLGTGFVKSTNGAISSGSIAIGDLPSIKLDDLSDATISTVTNNQLLKYNSTSSKWENWTPTYISSYSESDTLATVTGRGATTGTIITLTNTSITTSKTTGALVVTGGVGIGNGLWTSGAVNMENVPTFWNTTANTNIERGISSLIYSAIASGKCLYHDEEFASGNNSVVLYNNAGGTGIVITRQADSSAPNTSGQVLKITYNGSTTTPGLGGFVQQIQSRRNAVFVQRFRAKIPVGYSVWNNENSIGTGGQVYWITPKIGTGKWEEYIRVVSCGHSGTFSNSGYVYLSGTAGVPMEWYLASCTAFEVNLNPLNSLRAGTYMKFTTSTAQDTTLGNITIAPDTSVAWAFTNTTASTSTSTGALTVAGGVGVAGSLYAGSLYDNGNRVSTLSFTPVQQGGGIEQGTNKVYIGWSTVADSAGNQRLKATVDLTDIGNIVFDRELNAHNSTFSHLSETPMTDVNRLANLNNKLTVTKTNAAATNRPYDFATVLNIPVSGNSDFQIASSYDTLNKFYMRGRHDTTGNWKSWEQLITSNGGQINNTLVLDGTQPLTMQLTGQKRWLHHMSGGEYIIAPSTTINNNDWDWTKELKFKPNGDFICKNTIVASIFEANNIIRLKGTSYSSTAQELFFHTNFGNNVFTAVLYRPANTNQLRIKTGLDNTTHTDKFTFDHNGNFTATGDIFSNSDARLKNNVVPYGSALDKVNALEPVRYQRNDLNNKEEIGFIAQAVKEVEPLLVGYEKSLDIYSLDYGRMVVLLTQAVKELSDKVKKLENK
jgi:hypothetical protein